MQPFCEHPIGRSIGGEHAPFLFPGGHIVSVVLTKTKLLSAKSTQTSIHFLFKNTMKNSIAILFAILFCLSGLAQNEPAVTAFLDVNVIPMDKERVLLNQTVIVEGNRIKEIGNVDQIKVPAGAAIIHAKGLFLMPGMADMHASLPKGEADEINLHDYLALDVLRGVTSIRVMPGDFNSRVLRDSIRRGQVIGPELYLGSPVLPSDKELNAGKAEKLFDQYKKDNYQFLTCLNPMRPLLYDSVMKIAREKSMPVAGNVPNGGLEAAALQGQASIERMEPFLMEYKRDSGKFNTTVSELVKGKTYVCPDIQWYMINYNQLSVEQLNDRRGASYLSTSLLRKWKEPFEKDYLVNNNNKENKIKYLKKKNLRRMEVELGMKVIKNMNDAGVQMLISPGDGYYIIPGFGLLDECRDFVDAGISPFETLKAATVNAASFFGESSKWGTIASDKRADFVLLEGNPLEDIENLDKINGVMLRGNWLSKDDLIKIRTDICRRNQRETEEALKDFMMKENAPKDASPEGGKEK